MQSITIVSRKGGTGKTATAQALGAGLIKEAARVLFVDLDSQGNLSYTLQANADRPSAFDVLTGETDIQDAIQHAQKGDILTGSESLAKADAILKDTGKEYRLKEALEAVKDKYDYVMRGKVFQFSSDKKRNGDSNNQDSLCISISFGGLLLDISNLKRDNISGKPKAFEDIDLDEELYLLIKKLKK